MAAPIVVVSGPSGAGKTTVARLVAAAFELSVHIRTDDFTPFVVNGRVDPWLPASAHQSDVLGGAVAAAGMQFAEGGYTVVLDGHWFTEGLDGLAQMGTRRGVPVHYAVLRVTPTTSRRSPGCTPGLPTSAITRPTWSTRRGSPRGSPRPCCPRSPPGGWSRST